VTYQPVAAFYLQIEFHRGQTFWHRSDTLFKLLVVKILTWEAKLTLQRHKPFIIGVTGNLGKTSTKDAIFAVLKSQYHTRRSEKSMNSEFGVPLTILGEKSGWNNPLKWLVVIVRGLFVPFAKHYPTHLVLEVGADRPGDIKSIASWVKPNITVVTQFGEVPVHIEFFKDKDQVVTEKGYLVEALQNDGLFIYNADDYHSKPLLQKTNARKVGFGITHGADACAPLVKAYGSPIAGTETDVKIGSTTTHLVLPEVLGKSPVYCALPALLIAKELNVSFEIAAAALRDADKPKGRMRLLQGMNNTIIIDDTYNASPKATEHGIKALESIEVTGRKILVLGDMLELGEHTRDEHYKIGKLAAKVAHKLITVGIRARVIAEGALDEKMLDENILQCDSSILAGKELVAMLKEGDAVYIKGSQGMRMEKAVSMILASTHDPANTLVRQEKEWRNR
jgi:UDP-N-acetylmuramoyl-tripeptide--D-alanyl-D-alanine ligase